VVCCERRGERIQLNRTNILARLQYRIQRLLGSELAGHHWRFLRYFALLVTSLAHLLGRPTGAVLSRFTQEQDAR
jgi:hypothetical protein